MSASGYQPSSPIGWLLPGSGRGRLEKESIRFSSPAQKPEVSSPGTGAVGTQFY
jgi:hypothetical protein